MSSGETAGIATAEPLGNNPGERRAACALMPLRDVRLTWLTATASPLIASAPAQPSANPPGAVREQRPPRWPSRAASAAPDQHGERGVPPKPAAGIADHAGREGCRGAPARDVPREHDDQPAPAVQQPIHPIVHGLRAMPSCGPGGAARLLRRPARVGQQVTGERPGRRGGDQPAEIRVMSPRDRSGGGQTGPPGRWLLVRNCAGRSARARSGCRRSSRRSLGRTQSKLGADHERLAEGGDAAGRLGRVAGDLRTVHLHDGPVAVVDDRDVRPAAHRQGVAPRRRVGVDAAG